MLRHAVAAVLLVALFGAHNVANAVHTVDSKAGATLVDADLTAKMVFQAHYAWAAGCHVGRLSMGWDCDSICGDPTTAGTKVLGVLKNPLRQNSYSGFVALQPDNATIVFAIQGTESLQDAATDIVLLPTFNIQKRFPGAPLLSSVHVGFFNLFEAGIPSIQSAIDTILPQYPWVKRLVFTGHSLGAIQQNLNVPYFGPGLLAKGYKIETFAFAPARTVNNVFAKYLSTLPVLADGSFYRIVQRQDIIPAILAQVAPTFYRHIGTEYFVNVDAPGQTAPIYKCPSPALGEENWYCFNSVSPLEFSLIPGHTDYLGMNYWGCAVLAILLDYLKPSS
ncbi:alpha/beta-hydrolase [Gonapodya prolifera JEL478]|uniref:Alpha/beta-hydrolase n=1 Tax=Gonapodya prolifera (strain JEL478) TaxID=1344416 RepID=A0A139A201_GONPJ|nr:alpha/beta-hydrolase [Gonapodya prolifera JEL478]|eukprot:KXS10764.1 alpha/beta-hydrolase [Gonapodya prolifera JEL478]